jgi:hypothetical protein
MDSEEKKVDLDKPRIDIRLEILDQIPKGFVNEDNE